MSATLTTPTPCKGTCGRLLRPSRAKAAEYPGTVPHRAGGYCKGCRAALPADQQLQPLARTRAETPSHCSHCGHPMRPGHAKIADYPGTYRHVGSGICGRCRDAEGPQIFDPEGVRPDFDQAQATAALEAWLAARRTRLGNVHPFPTPARQTERIAA